jgi:hypothetical protein
MDWHNPTIEEIKAIHNPADIPVISVVDGLTNEDRKLIYDSLEIKPEYKSDFTNVQTLWLSDFKNYWGKNHKIEPDGCEEFGNDLVNSHEYERFRLYYAAKHPEGVIIKKVNKKVLEFLLETEQATKFGDLIIAYLSQK